MLVTMLLDGACKSANGREGSVCASGSTVVQYEDIGLYRRNAGSNTSPPNVGSEMGFRRPCTFGVVGDVCCSGRRHALVVKELSGFSGDCPAYRHFCDGQSRSGEVRVLKIGPLRVDARAPDARPSGQVLGILAVVAPRHNHHGRLLGAECQLYVRTASGAISSCREYTR